ncbi:hypothetical protein JMA_36200 [Jeotgalibacillus malaysiensis]|uniref:DUF4375 domain-containing protein n=1 Tax=Jeotgalibacillus malaysiensis TaxID=1508404 RepID=A0A0B5AW59_9BACL|nr:hypothetical protein [Jeotgalibacillus malaysiensis]AJD92937.1 hypothetical protein JMA_36200 [Jeotgalibacillus malaysiensis]
MKNHFTLTPEHFNECREMIGHILWMYHDMTRSYGGFAHNIDYEPVDYERFLFTEVDAETMFLHEKEAEVLRQGALVALGCNVVNLLDEAQRHSEVYNFIINALSHPTITHKTFEKEVLSAMKSALDEEPDVAWESLDKGSMLEARLAEVYEKYVLGYYQMMLNGSESGMRNWGKK